MSLSSLCEQQHQHPLGRRAQKSLHHFLHLLAASLCSDLPWSVLVYLLNSSLFQNLLYLCLSDAVEEWDLCINKHEHEICAYSTSALGFHLALQLMCMVLQFLPILVFYQWSSDNVVQKLIVANGIKASKTILSTVLTCRGKIHASSEFSEERIL